MPDEIMEALRQSVGLDEDDTSKDEELNALSLKDTLNAYLAWNGVEGYTDDILEILKHKMFPNN